MAAKMLLSSCLFLLAWMCVPHPFLDEFQGPLVLRDLEQLHGAPLTGDKATHLLDHVPHELGVFVRCPQWWLAHILCHFVALVGAHGPGVAESHGCCSPVVAAAEGPHICFKMCLP